MAEGHRALRAARSVLDGREHGRTLNTDGRQRYRIIAVYARI